MTTHDESDNNDRDRPARRPGGRPGFDEDGPEPEQPIAEPPRPEHPIADPPPPATPEPKD